MLQTSSGSKVESVHWTALGTGNCIGIVITDNGYERKAYIGMGLGVDEKSDTLLIAEHGSKFPLNAAELLMK